MPTEDTRSSSTGDSSSCSVPSSVSPDCRRWGQPNWRQCRDRGIAFVAASLAQAKDGADQLAWAEIHAQLKTLQAQAKAVEPLQTSVDAILFNEKLLYRFFTRPCRFIVSTQVRQSFRQLQTFLSSLF